MDTKKIAPALTKVGLNAGGAILGYAVVKNAPSKIRKFAGPGLVVGGILLSTLKNEHLQEVGQGMSVVGVIDAIDQFTPASLKAKAGNFLPALGSLEDEYDEFGDMSDFERSMLMANANREDLEGLDGDEDDYHDYEEIEDDYHVPVGSLEDEEDEDEDYEDEDYEDEDVIEVPVG